MHKPNPLKQIFHTSRRFFAKNWFNFIKPYTIGITGSMGKTYTTHILNGLYPDAVVTDINLDTLYNIPITALKLKKDSNLAIFEYGIDKIGEMNLHLQIAKPNIAIVTGITSVHTDYEHLGSLENLIKEKRKLVECLSKEDFAILNYDDENVREMAKATKAKVIFFGSNHHKCDVFFNPNRTEITLDGSSYELTDSSESMHILINTKLFGSLFIYNIMASYIAFKLIETKKGRTINEIVNIFLDSISQVKPLKGRMSFEKVSDFQILNDSLRSNPLSIKNGLETFAMLNLDQNQRKIIVLGEMGELGMTEEKEHKKLGEIIASINKFDLFVGIGPLQQIAINSAISAGLKKDKTIYCKNALEAGLALKNYLNKGDVIYLKGSLLRHMERILMTINKEKISCDVVSCPFYNSCRVCKYKDIGYKA
jgi:UDP-N-acetylmuramoyl-tripeptide--D-alanyl-D-alanine ligase